VSSVRLFFVGGLLSFRALFGWLSPWILIPTYVIAPIFQILLFVYIGRAAKTQSDEFYVIGNALQYAAIPCVFAMTTRSPASATRTPSEPCSRPRRNGSRSSSADRCR
jgi:ABC-2 type transport system permease protein